jgi:hypothetical protein
VEVGEVKCVAVWEGVREGDKVALIIGVRLGVFEGCLVGLSVAVCVGVRLGGLVDEISGKTTSILLAVDVITPEDVTVDVQAAPMILITMNR